MADRLDDPAVRELVAEARRETLRASADPVLLRLLREAFELINDADSQLDRRDWTREARKVLQEG